MRRRAAVLAALGALYLLCLRAYYVGFFNDDAFYLIGAKSLLQGRYVELNAPGEPPLIQYPPGYSILLAQVAWLFGDSTLAAQLFSVALTLGFVGLSWALLAAELPAAAAVAAAAMVAFNPLTASLSGTVLSDLPLAALMALLLVAARSRWASREARHWLLLGLLAGFGALIRTTGAALPLALCAALLLERRWRDAAVAGAASLSLPGAFWLRNRLLSGSPELRLLELFAPYRGEGAGSMLETVLRNAWYYARELFVRAWFRWPDGPVTGALELLTVAAAALLCGWGLRRWGGKGWRKLLPLLLLVWVAGHLAWQKQSGRYLLPVLPLAAALLHAGLAEADRRFLRGRGRLSWAALALSAGLSVPPVWNVVSTSLWRRTPVNTPPERTLGWLRSGTDHSEVVACELDGRLHLLTGRKTVHLRRLPPEAFHRWLRDSGADYVLVFPNDYVMKTASGANFNDPLPVDTLKAMLSDPARYDLVFLDEGEGSQIYRVKE